MPKPSASWSRPLIACLLAGVLPLAGACDRKSTAPEQANAVIAASPDEAAPGGARTPASPVGGLDRSHKGEPMPAVAFQTLDGKPDTLAAHHGRPLLVNLWATWCGPCLKEMPTLDALAAQGGVAVLPVSQDLDGAAKVGPYLAHAALKALKPALDPKLSLSLAYQANLPTSVLYGSDGREVWRYAGSLDWTGAKAKGLLAEAR